MTREELNKMSTSELLDLMMIIIKPKAEKLIFYTEANRLCGYDHDLLAIYHVLKIGGYDD